MIELLERQKKLTANQWKLICTANVADLLDFFDFFLIGFVLAFVVKEWHLTYGQSGAILLASGVSAPFGSLLYGLMADKIGRRKAMVIALAGAVLVVPLWTYSPNLALLVTGAFLMQFMVQGAWGVIPAHLAELSPDSVRGFLPGFAYQCGVLLASSIFYIQAVFATRMSYATAMALTGTTVFVLAGIMSAIGKEKRGVAFGQ